MKLVFLLIAGMAGALQSASLPCNFLFNGTLADSLGNMTAFSQNGTIPFLATSCTDLNLSMAGQFSNTNNLYNADLATALLATPNNWKIEFDVNLAQSNGFASNPTFISSGTAPGNVYVSPYAGAPNKWRFTANGTDEFSAAVSTITGCYHIALGWDGVTKTMVVNGETVISTATSATWTGTVFRVGSYLGTSAPLDGYIQNLKVSTYSAPATPVPTPVVPVYTSYSGNPVFSPLSAWEDNWVDEPRILKDSSVLRMFYTGGSTAYSIGEATSTNGINWTRTSNNPVVGNGYGGVTAGQYTYGPNIIKDQAGLYRLYYGRTDDNNMHQATSSDGVTFSQLTYTTIAFSQISGTDQIYNSRCYYDGSNYWMTVEARYTSGVQWRPNLFKSIDGGNTYQLVYGPLYSAEISAGMWSSMQPFLSGGVFQHLYHAAPSGSSPTYIYWAWSIGLIGFYPNTTPVIPLAGNEMGLAAPDQVADPWTIQVGSQNLTYFEAVQNNIAASRIGFAYTGSSVPNVSALFGGGTRTVKIRLGTKLKLH